MILATTGRFRVPSSVHARRFGDELVVLDLGAGKYFSLDSVGSSIWDQLISGKTTAETVAAVLEKYDADEDNVRSDVQRLTEELLSAGLLEPHE